MQPGCLAVESDRYDGKRELSEFCSTKNKAGSVDGRPLGFALGCPPDGAREQRTIRDGEQATDTARRHPVPRQWNVYRQRAK